ncbi:unnamed protein product, partial [marine sediment metagenome]
MAELEIIALDEAGLELEAPQAGDTYVAKRDVSVEGNIAVTGTVDGRNVAADGAAATSAVQPADNISVLTNDSGFEANVDLASQSEAEAGVENTKTMTPLRVLQAISANKKNNDSAVVAPTVTDDDSDGYSVGSRWTDVVADLLYFCVDSTANVAIWTRATSFDSEMTGDWDAGDFDIELGSVTFKPQATDLPHAPGQIQYHAEHGGHFVAHVEDTDVSLQIGEEDWISVRNDTGLAIEDGTPVYIIGFSSGLPQIAPIIADGERCVGLTTHSIETATIGKVTRGGQITGPNLTSYSIGDTLYISTTVAGEMTNVTPYWPDTAIEVGQVLYNANPGVINVDIEHHGNKNLMAKSYNFSARTASSGVYYLGGFYDAPAADVNLDQAGTTQTYGS